MILLQKPLGTPSRIPASNAPTPQNKSLTSISHLHTTISHPLSQPINELGANFFFAKYSINESPFSNEYHDWLARSYFEGEPSHVLRAAINAVGMAGISNVFHAPHVASKSKEQYCKALAAMKQALDNPVEAVADTTFMAIILLGLFEVRTLSVRKLLLRELFPHIYPDRQLRNLGSLSLLGSPC